MGVNQHYCKKFGSHWFKAITYNEKEKNVVEKFGGAQSHGGHHYVPLADQSHDKSPQRKNAHGKKRS
jgi:hypothetical protein